jgi:hypothetical protein
MLDPAQNGKPTLPKPLAGLSQDRTNRPEPLMPPSQRPRQHPDHTMATLSTPATHHTSLRVLIASQPIIKIQCKLLKTKDCDLF